MLTIEPTRGTWPHPQLDENWKAGRDVWVEVSAEFWLEMRDVVPPVLFTMRSFMVGEAYTHNERGVVYTGLVHVGDRYFARTCNACDFIKLRDELRAHLSQLTTL